MPATSARKYVEPLILLVFLVAIGFIGWRCKNMRPDLVTAMWLGNMALLLAFAVVTGHAITGFWRGVLIDSRNKISLSQLQMFLWTILLLSGFLTAVLVNIHKGLPHPLSIALHADLWALMGISTTSLVGSPLIKNSKKGQPTNMEATVKTEALLDTQGARPLGGVKPQGQLLINQELAGASWVDLFKGEEVGNAAHLDLGKIQMFYFTLIIWFTYAITLGNLLRTGATAGITAFPDLDSGMVALLGISHAAYLTNKAIPHTPQEPTSPP